MVRRGIRPRRERRRTGCVRFITANVNCVDRLYEEVRVGSCFKQADYLMVQEVRTRGEAANRARKHCRELGWDAIGGDSYLKESRAGGGAMILTRGDGLGPLAEEQGEFLGRLTLGIASDLHGVVIGCLYGVTGGKVADQLGCWRRLATRLTALGRPFVVGGDWQVDPEDPEMQRLAMSLDAIVVHPNAATNLHSQSRIDYFLVSRALLGGGWAAHVDHSCAFSPHAAVVLELTLTTAGEKAYRLSQPRLLPVDPPVGPLLPRVAEVAWGDWTTTINDDDRMDAEGLGRAVTQWSAGAEVELFDSLGIPPDERVHYMGIGAETRVVTASATGRFRDVADELGITGQRLCWALKGVRLLTSAAAAAPGSDAQRKRIEVCSRLAWRAAAFLRAARKSTPIDGNSSTWTSPPNSWPLWLGPGCGGTAALPYWSV
jgi:exonuclease III